MDARNQARRRRNGSLFRNLRNFIRALHHALLASRVDEVIRAWADTCRNRRIDVKEKLADDDPNKPLVDTVRYLTNNPFAG